MKNNEISIKYGVPTPQTCKELDWKEETLFYWGYLTHPFGVNLYLCVKKNNEFFIIDDENPIYLQVTSLEKLKIYPAPQMHEILEKLPNRIEKDGFMYNLYISKLSVVYITIDVKLLFGIHLSSGVTEQSAQMYIKLKNENLI